MGSRANLAVKKDGRWQRFYDRRCAQHLDTELFWGPDAATQFIEQVPPVGEDHFWLDEDWCEGAAVIDHDRRFLGWFGGSYVFGTIFERRALLALMQHQWPGWEIRWLCGGTVEWGDYLGVDRQFFRSDKGVRRAEFRILPDPELNCTLLTVRTWHDVTAAQIWGNARSLQIGAEQLPTLLAIPRSANLGWSGEMPDFGVHFDLCEDTISYWSVAPAEFVEERVAEAWTGWKTRWLRDNFEEHLKLAPVALQLPIATPSEVLAWQRGYLQQFRDDIAKQLQNSPLATGKNADQIDPHTPRYAVGSNVTKLTVLDKLLAAYGEKAS